MSDSYIQPPANTGVGPLVDTELLTVSGNGVNRQRIILADPTDANSKLKVAQLNNTDANAATSYAIQTQAVNALYNGTTIDRQRSAPGTTGIAAVNTESTKTTYGIAGLVVLAATPSDVVILNGSGTKTIRVTRVEVSISATAAGVADVLLIKRSVANSGGTAATPTPVPYDSSDAAASSVVSVYTANPTPGAAIGTIRTTKIGISAASGQNTFEWTFTDRNTKGLVLRGVAQGLAINLNGDALLTGESFGYSIEWTEE